MSLSPWPCNTGVSLLPAISCRGSEGDRVAKKGVGRGVRVTGWQRREWVGEHRGRVECVSKVL